MKRLLDEPHPSFGSLLELLRSAARYELSPFSKPAIKSRLARAATAPKVRRRGLQLALIGGAGLLAATAAAAGYSMWTPSSAVGEPAHGGAPASPAPRALAARAPVVPAEAEPAPSEPAPSESAPAVPSSARRGAERPRAGEDPSQVAEAVRALRKQGDAARAQALLEQYLKTNPRGALAEDALALSIEAALARKDARAADYARRYLARYPNGRFRAVAERALSR